MEKQIRLDSNLHFLVRGLYTYKNEKRKLSE